MDHTLYDTETRPGLQSLALIGGQPYQPAASGGNSDLRADDRTLAWRGACEGDVGQQDNREQLRRNREGPDQRIIVWT